MSDESESSPLEVNFESLPRKSRWVYKNTYAKYAQWKTENQVQKTSEDVLLAYFSELKTKYAPPTLWSQYAMLKQTIYAHEKVSIKGFDSIKAMLKRANIGYTFKKAKTLTEEHVKEFLKTAPDETYLAMKVILIFGIAGCCRGAELYNIKKHHVKPQGDVILVEISDAKTKKARRFIINEEFVPYVKKYQDLHTERITLDNFFIRYIDGRLNNQVIGKERITKVPQDIAKFLNLEDYNRYTGHCFRRMSASLAVKGSANELRAEPIGEWTSSKTADECIEDDANSETAHEFVEEDVDSKTILHNLLLKEVGSATKRKIKTETFSTVSNLGVSDEEKNVNISYTAKSTSKQMCFNNCNVTINYNSSV